MCNLCGDVKWYCPYCDEVETVTFSGRSFCFSGHFNYGTKNACEKAVKEQGGSVRTSVTNDLNYLVVGGKKKHPNYRYDTHGNKINEAQDNQHKDYPVIIICEQVWKRSLDNAS
jgi:NAD-dependent DNA ligase